MNHYVISLKNATKRRTHILNEFGKHDIAFEFFDAITPTDINKLANKFDINLDNSPLSDGEKGCLLSHMSLWQKAIDNKLNYIGIFEDDIYLGNNASLFLNNNHWLSGIDILKLEMFDTIRYMHSHKIPTINHRHLRQLKEEHLGTAGYILSNQAAYHLMTYVKHKDNLDYPVDNIIFDRLIKQKNIDMPVYQLIPAICIQADRLDSNSELSSQLNHHRLLRRDKINKQHKKPLSIDKKIKRELIRPFQQLKRHYIDINKSNTIGFL